MTAPRLETIALRAVAGVVVVYALGLSVVMLHLVRYGVYNPGLVQPQYLLTGIWVLVPLVVIGFIATAVTALVLRPNQAQRGGEARSTGSFVRPRDMVIGVLGVTLGMLALAVFFLEFVSDRSSEDAGASFGAGELLFVGVVVLGFLAAMAWGVGIALFARTAQTTDMLYRGLGLGLAIAALIAYIGYFTDVIYPRIPSAAGGGAPTAVQMVLKADSSPTTFGSVLRGLPTEAACRHRLLFANAQNFIIVDPRDSNNGIEISRDLVAAMRTVTGRVEPCAR